MRVWARMLAGSSLAIRGRTTGVAAALKCGRLLALRALTLFLVCNVGSPRHSQLWRSQESFIGAVALSMWVWLPRWVRAGACNVRVSSGLSICGARLVRWAMRHQPSLAAAHRGAMDIRRENTFSIASTCRSAPSPHQAAAPQIPRSVHSPDDGAGTSRQCGRPPRRSACCGRSTRTLGANSSHRCLAALSAAWEWVAYGRDGSGPLT